ncbi:dTDP-4-dehydrorhamnose 3,5-epimerase [Roseateles toxinivorans]|uniref:dTDP-4-dehydrorhamnose 3,5-epimerase n=1 Tax=Roseateles toxinivorans TaxID=270368 RepID=A0A4R6QMQ0_9BURK|nr:dTDP-4-dehydrorhamnose 3,5-epimerase [Roseateles toxinivorans]TDP71416.1 dTDP-4-dehydrorhamnose 3,5-epimerase [Roseateles toxinivorans]
MKPVATPIEGLVVLESRVFGDERGWFTESFNQRGFEVALRDLGQSAPPAFVQDNHSCSQRGVLRGLHYQLPPHAQGKLVRVVRGSAYDVAVDIRRGSPTFGQSFGLELSAANRIQLWIPAGFAHGFLAMEDDTHFLYKTTDYYDPKSERSIAWNDPGIGINWPGVAEGLITPNLAPKDAAAPEFAAAELF